MRSLLYENWTPFKRISNMILLQLLGKCIARSPACAGRSNGRKNMWYVYILKSEKYKWYYVGSTNNLERRLIEHNHKRVSSTIAFAPLQIVWKKDFLNEVDCRAYERMLKDKRIEKERIIRKEIG